MVGCGNYCTVKHFKHFFPTCRTESTKSAQCEKLAEQAGIFQGCFICAKFPEYPILDAFSGWIQVLTNNYQRLAMSGLRLFLKRKLDIYLNLVHSIKLKVNVMATVEIYFCTSELVYLKFRSCVVTNKEA